MKRKTMGKVMVMIFVVAMVLSVFTIATSKVCAITVNLTTSLDDTYVNSANPNDNYGLATYLLVGTETWGSSTKTIYTKFNISPIPESAIILNASIYLRLGAGPFCGNFETISAYHVTNHTWNETMITYSTQPGFNLTTEDTISVAGTPPYWYKWSVTNMVKREFYDGNKRVSIALRGEGPGQCDKPFYSKESLESQYHPYLKVNYIVVKSTVVSCNASGIEKNEFCPGEDVYVKATGLEASTDYKIWIQDDPVNEDKELYISEDLSGSQEIVTTNESGSFAPILIWNIPPEEPVTYHEYDIVVDKQNDGVNTGKYNVASDGIDSASVVGFVALSLWTEINEELDALIVNVSAADITPNIIKRRLLEKLEYAKELKENAKIEYEAGNVEGAKKKLGVAKSQVESFESMVKITRRINRADKASFLEDSAKIIEKIGELIGKL